MLRFYDRTRPYYEKASPVRRFLIRKPQNDMWPRAPLRAAAILAKAVVRQHYAPCSDLHAWNGRICRYFLQACPRTFGHSAPYSSEANTPEIFTQSHTLGWFTFLAKSGIPSLIRDAARNLIAYKINDETLGNSSCRRSAHSKAFLMLLASRVFFRSPPLFWSEVLSCCISHFLALL